MSLNIAADLRTALLDASTISPHLAAWEGEPGVFTKRPVPADAKMPMILVNPDAAIGDMDWLNDEQPLVVRDIAIYGNQPDDYRMVETLGYAVRALFHRQKWSILPLDYDVVSIVARGPVPGPVDDDKTVARIVGLTIRLRRKT